MTEQQKIERVKALINDASVDDATVSVYLDLAGGKILDRCYPFVPDTSKTKEIEKEDGTKEIVPMYPMPKKYDLIHCELASRYIFRRGFEGQNSSSENGIQRSWKSVNDDDLLSEVMQMVGVVNV